MDKKMLLILVAAALIVVSAVKLSPSNSDLRITSHAIASTKVVVYGGCYWVVYPGWNNLAFCSNSSNVAEDVKNHIGNVKFILKWNEQTQKFEVYSPRAAKNPFDSIDYNESFFILFEPNNNSDIIVDNVGSEFDRINLNIVNGWNAAPYPYTFPSSFQSVSSIFGDYRFILKWNPTMQFFDVYSSKSVPQNLPDFDVGQALFVFMEHNKKVIYDPNELS